MNYKTYLQNTLLMGITWGVIGGVFLILFRGTTTNGPLQISPYPFLLLLATLTFAIYNKSNVKLNQLFKVGLSTFMIMTVFLYLYITIFVNPNSGISAFGHFWRLASIFGIGAVASIITAYFAKFFASK